ncbi:hypothetical protein Bca4012_027223 [Brassica carinata]
MKLVDVGRIRWTTSTAWSKKTYYTPDVPQYSQQMIVGHARPVFFMSPSPYLQDIIPYIFVKVCQRTSASMTKGTCSFGKRRNTSHTICVEM